MTDCMYIFTAVKKRLRCGLNKYFSKAATIAEASDYKKVHVGCVAVYHNTIIGMGCNSNKTHPKQKYYNRYREMDEAYSSIPKIHAEIMCLNSIARMDIDFSKVHLYIYRQGRDRPCRITRPCAACMKAIKDMGIKHIHYTTDVGYAYEIIKEKKDEST